MNNGVYCVICGNRIWFKWPWSAAICGNCKNKKDQKAKQEKTFYCGTCYYTYKENLLANENIKDGKICRFCWEKRLKEKDNEK